MDEQPNTLMATKTAAVTFGNRLGKQDFPNRAQFERRDWGRVED